jgi:hypothetical protein
MLITVVADYGVGDLAFAEVRQRFAKRGGSAADAFGRPASGTPVEITRWS